MSNDKELGWFLVELMGHQHTAAHIAEITLAGYGMLRLEIFRMADTTPCKTQIINPSAVYRLTVTTEEVARACVSRGTLPLQLLPPDPPEPDDPLDGDDFDDETPADEADLPSEPDPAQETLPFTPDPAA